MKFLRHMGIATVVVPTPSTVDGVIQNVMDIAHIIGEDEINACKKVCEEYSLNLRIRRYEAN